MHMLPKTTLQCPLFLRWHQIHSRKEIVWNPSKIRALQQANAYKALQKIKHCNSPSLPKENKKQSAAAHKCIQCFKLPLSSKDTANPFAARRCTHTGLSLKTRRLALFQRHVAAFSFLHPESSACSLLPPAKNANTLCAKFRSPNVCL